MLELLRLLGLLRLCFTLEFELGNISSLALCLEKEVPLSWKARILIGVLGVAVVDNIDCVYSIVAGIID